MNSDLEAKVAALVPQTEERRGIGRGGKVHPGGICEPERFA